MKNKLIYAILSLLGLTMACSKDDNGTECMYGTPTATFSVKGRVTDTEGKPLEGIRINIVETSTFTDAQGRFDFTNASSTNWDDNPYKKMEFLDVDGEKNGSFKGHEMQIKFSRNQNAPSNEWHLGDYDAPDIDVVLQAGSEDE